MEGRHGSLDDGEEPVAVTEHPSSLRRQRIGRVEAVRQSLGLDQGLLAARAEARREVDLGRWLAISRVGVLDEHVPPLAAGALRLTLVDVVGLAHLAQGSHAAPISSSTSGTVRRLTSTTASSSPAASRTVCSARASATTAALMLEAGPEKVVAGKPRLAARYSFANVRFDGGAAGAKADHRDSRLPQSGSERSPAGHAQVSTDDHQLRSARGQVGMHGLELPYPERSDSSSVEPLPPRNPSCCRSRNPVRRPSRHRCDARPKPIVDEPAARGPVITMVSIGVAAPSGPQISPMGCAPVVTMATRRSTVSCTVSPIVSMVASAKSAATSCFSSAIASATSSSSQPRARIRIRSAASPALRRQTVTSAFSSADGFVWDPPLPRQRRPQPRPSRSPAPGPPAPPL